MTGTLLAIFQTRLELLTNEMQEERLCIEQKLFYGSPALFFLGLSAILLTAIVVVVFWDSYRLPLLAGFTGVYFVAGIMALHALRCVAEEKSKLFSASQPALADDRDQLAPRP